MSTRFCRATFALTLAAGMSCWFVTAVPAQAQKKMTLVQMHPNMGIGEEVFLYAVPKRLGYFAAEGLDIDIQNSQTGMISAQALQANSAQIGTTAAAAIMTVREQNGDLVSFFNLKRNAGTFLVVLEELANPETRRSQGQDDRRALVWRGRWVGLEAEPRRDRHHARSVHRHFDWRRAVGDRGPAHRPDRSVGDVGRDARRRREHRTGAAHGQHSARRRSGRDDACGQEVLRQRKSKGRRRLLPRHDQGPAVHGDQSRPPPSASSGRSFRPPNPPTWTTPPRSRTACTS